MMDNRLKSKACGDARDLVVNKSLELFPKIESTVIASLVSSYSN
jgi:hypothetical protein